MKSKTLMMEHASTHEPLNSEKESEPVSPKVIFYRKEQLKKEISFHKKMILITVLSVLAAAAFYLLV